MPLAFRNANFDHLPNISHPGIHATQKLATTRFLWPSINVDVHRWAQTCLECQRFHCHIITSESLLQPPDARFSHVHLDIVGPLPSSRGTCYLLTYVYRFPRWEEAIPITNIMAETVAMAFMSSWVLCFRCLSVVTTDRGRQFHRPYSTRLPTFLTHPHDCLPSFRQGHGRINASTTEGCPHHL